MLWPICGLQFLWRNGGPSSNIHLIHSVWVNFQTSTNNIIFGNRWRHLLGESNFWEHVGGIDISLAPSSFGQANTRVTQLYIPSGFFGFPPPGSNGILAFYKCTE
uniref:Uncharacterized protein n=1 Tax=Nelumbo nucifera TaxID=4432 RepID=A0A822YEL0_NELNU|nr:TPA_asm: hypothetical protein HUJ06_009444 [Nelumbo nucifera]